MITQPTTCSEDDGSPPKWVSRTAFHSGIIVGVSICCMYHIMLHREGWGERGKVYISFVALIFMHTTTGHVTEFPHHTGASLPTPVVNSTVPGMILYSAE